MRPFTYQAAAQPAAAVQAAASSPQTTAYLAGGTTLLDLMKLDVMRPQTLVDLGGMERRWREIDVNRDGLRIGALARMSDVAEHREVLRDYPAVAQSLQLAASQQLRNMASMGGNLLQRTRCPYFRDIGERACNKRVPGSGCAALEGYNRLHAVLGVSDSCIASYPGDFANVFVAFDGVVEVLGPAGARMIRAADLHTLPGVSPHIETTLQPGELITALRIPAGRHTRRSLYLKVRDRASYAFASASAVVGLDMDGDTVREARIGLGGVASKPWRSAEAEAALRGQAITEETAAAAARAAFASARTREHNAYKRPLGERTLVRALLTAARLEA